MPGWSDVVNYLRGTYEITTDNTENPTWMELHDINAPDTHWFRLDSQPVYWPFGYHVE